MSPSRKFIEYATLPITNSEEHRERSQRAAADHRGADGDQQPTRRDELGGQDPLSVRQLRGDVGERVAEVAEEGAELLGKTR